MGSTVLLKEKDSFSAEVPFFANRLLLFTQKYTYK